MATSTNNTASVFRSTAVITFGSGDADGTLLSADAAHGLGVVPDLVQVWAIANSANNGYAIGDRVLVAVNHGGSLHHRSFEDGFWIVADATNIRLAFSQDGNNGVANLRSFTDGALVVLDLTKWDFLVVAVAFIAPP